MESPLAAIETNRNIKQETPRTAAVDKDQDQVVRKLLAEVTELRSEVTKLKTSQARRQLYKPSKIKDPECSVSFKFRFLLEMRGIGL